jgi:succinate dehydrogenase / fumarate reductase cytochrome b subunit
MTARIERPLSPHLQTYRWTLTMALSIVHRATGLALYFGTLLLAWWLIAAASGPSAYANVQAFTGSVIGRLILFGYTWALMHHLLSGIRHFVWDLGYGFKANEREALTWGALLGGISLTVLVWIAAYAAGAAQILGSLPIAVILLLFIIASTWHMKIGMQVVIEDYLHNEKLKLAAIMANNFFSFAVALASIYALLKLSSGV